jgi:molybdopterin-guanine dinucleotide biosynthesis protein A
MAGGASRRFGADKALALFGAETLLARMCSLLQLSTARVRIVAARGRYADSGFDVVEDHWPDQGPLGGIITALRATQGASGGEEWNLILSCDMPFMTSEFTDSLIATSLASAAEVVVPRSAHGLEPLCACWRTSAVTNLQSEFEAGVRKVTDAMKRLRMEVLDETHWKRFDSAGRLFWNMNTPQDYQTALQMWKTERT